MKIVIEVFGLRSLVIGAYKPTNPNPVALVPVKAEVKVSLKLIGADVDVKSVPDAAATKIL